MTENLFEQIRLLSLEIRSLVKQGVKEGVEERIEHRNALLEQWFQGITQLIQLTNEQQTFLEDLLREEQALVAELQQEQSGLAQVARNKKKASMYQQH